MHALAVAAQKHAHSTPAVRLGLFAFASGKIEAGGKPLDIPFKRPAQGLIKVVDVKGQIAVHRGIGPQITHMGITAKLVQKARVRLLTEVMRHHRHGTAKVAKGGLGHAVVLEFEQVRQAILRGTVQDFERTAARSLAMPLPMGGARHLFAAALALGLAILF